MASSLKTYAFRLRPNQDLNKELDDFVKKHDLKAAFIMTCVGSLTKAIIRMAYDKNFDVESNRVKTYEQHMEIVSLVGTLSSVGGHHLHISLSDKDGNLVGGHVFGELNVFTTAEVVIGECVNLIFDREDDAESGFKELEVKQR